MPPGHGPQAPRTLGRYELVVELAKGQLGPLWLAHVGPELFGIRRVRTAAPIESADVERLSAAAKWSLEVEHENVARVVDVVSSDGELGVVLKYVAGEPLRSLLRLSSFKRKPVPPAIAMRIGLDVLNGLAAVHEHARSGGAGAGIASGGVNPDAVLIGATPGHAVLLDVGIASAASSVPSLAQHFELGAYAAPELVDDPRAADARSDVFSLGVLLWEMISSRRLFAGASEAVIREKLAACAVPRLDASLPVGGEPVAAEIADVVARALARDPADRYQDVAAMAAAIQGLGPDAIAEPAAVAAMVEDLAGQAIKTRTKLSKRAVAGKNTPILGPRPPQSTLVGIAPDDPLFVAVPKPQPAPEPSVAAAEPSAPESAPSASDPESSIPISLEDPEPSIPEPTAPKPKAVQRQPEPAGASAGPMSEPDPTTRRRASSPGDPLSDPGAISERELVEALTRESNPGPPPLDSIDFTWESAETKKQVPATAKEEKIALPKLTSAAAPAPAPGRALAPGRAPAPAPAPTRAPAPAPAPTRAPAPALAPARAPELSDPLFEAPPSLEQIQRTQKARKVVGGVVAGLAALLVIGLVISAVRSSEDPAAPTAAREATEPPRPTPAVPAPDPAPEQPAPVESAPVAASATPPTPEPEPKPEAKPDPPARTPAPVVERRAKTKPVSEKPRVEERTSSKPAPRRPAATTAPTAKPKAKKPKYVPSGI